MFIRENFITAINCLTDGFNLRPMLALFGCCAPWPIESIISEIRVISALGWMNNSGERAGCRGSASDYSVQGEEDNRSDAFTIG